MAARCAPEVPERTETSSISVESPDVPVMVSSANRDLLARLTAWCTEQGLTPSEDVTLFLEVFYVFAAQNPAGGTNKLLLQELIAVHAEVESTRADLETARQSCTMSAADAHTGAFAEVQNYQERRFGEGFETLHHQHKETILQSSSWLYDFFDWLFERAQVAKRSEQDDGRLGEVNTEFTTRTTDHDATHTEMT